MPGRQASSRQADRQVARQARTGRQSGQAGKPGRQAGSRQADRQAARQAGQAGMQTGWVVRSVVRREICVDIET